ncbi:MAG: hypothetical protein L6Q81_12600 [Bacteroidia bacterium]|nr:hypothetical protein [Bacteroidia bacterium]
MALVINPSFVSGNSSEIPITAGYQWKILKFVKGFRSENFDHSDQAYFDLLRKITGVSDVHLLSQGIQQLIFEEDPIQFFIDDYNTAFSPSPSLVRSNDPDENVVLADLVTQIDQLVVANPLLPNTPEALFQRYINLANSTDIAGQIQILFQKHLGDFSFENIRALLVPQAFASIENIDLALEFPRKYLKPIDPNTGEVIDENSPLPEDQRQKSKLEFHVGSVDFSTQHGIQFEALSTFSLSPSQIGDTGFRVSVTGLKLDLSRTKNIPEATADGRPADFIGAYITEGTIGFPLNWNHNDPNSINDPSTGELFVDNLLIGTGGLSGNIGLRAINQNNPSPFLKGTFGQNIKWTLDTFSITFQQNSITDSEISGTLTVPGFTNTSSGPAILDIKINVGGSGDFSVTASDLVTPPTWAIANVLTIAVSSAYVGRKNGRFYLGVTGKIDFIAEVPVLGDVLPKGVEVKKLIIWDDGSIEFEGGNLILPNAIALKIGPVKLSITALSMGSYERGTRKYKYVGFDGGINVSPGGVDARANGVKLYYSVDNDPLDIFVRIEGIAIDLIIPGSAKPEDAAVILSGFLSMKDPDPNIQDSDAGSEYAGAVSFSLPRANMTGSAAMRFQPNWPAFIIDASLDLSTPIPLGSTGLSIYGFRGLLGLSYVAARDVLATAVTNESPWYQYYKAKTPSYNTEGINIEKFAKKPGFSLGAGVSLATGADQGKSFSSKLFFLLSLPDVFLLQGQGAVLRERVGLDTVNDPPFSALIAISKQSVEAAFGVNYKLPEDSGKIATVDGLIEMGFFFGNNSAWYINVGRDLPVEKRVQARILSLFNAYFYLMLSSGGIKAGAGASWAFSKSFGPVGIEAGAYIDLAGRISFKPKQIGGSIQLGGYAQIKVFKFKLGMSIAASLAAEAPKPFIVTGAVEVAINLPKPLKDLSVNVDFTWTFDATLNAAEEEIIDAADFELKPPAKAVSMVTNETFALFYSDTASLPGPSTRWADHVIPMDSYIDIEFTKGVYPDISVATVNQFGGVTTGTSAHIELIPPQRGKSDQVKHTYEVKNIEVFSWNGTAWVAYDPFDAYVDLNDPLFQQLTQTQLNALKFGFWQKDSNDKYNKLRVLAQSPLNFLSQGTGNLPPEELGVFAESLFCDDTPLENICIDFNPSEALQTIAEVPVDSPVNYRGVLLKMNSISGIILLNSSWGSDYALSIPTDDSLEIIFPEPCANVYLNFAQNNNVTIEFYRRSLPVATTNSNLPVYEWELITSGSQTTYEDSANPVDRVVIINGACEQSNFDCGTELTPEAQQLLTFFDALENNTDLTETFKLYPHDTNAYDNIFQGTVLYDPPYEYNDINYVVELVTLTQLIVTISDDQGFSCGFTLELATYDPDFDMSEITKFENLVADPDYATNGANYHFLIEATTPDGTFTLKGTSCYPINYCFDSCHSWLYSICRLPVSSVEFNATIPTQTQVTADNNSMLDGILKITPPVWRPNTDYFVKIETKDTITNIDSPPGPYTSYHGFGFRTAGPVGHFHELRAEYDDLAAKDKADQFRLASLKPYIDYTTSYPNADGNILNAKPLFYENPKLLLYYKYAHIYTMLRNWDAYNGNDGVDIELTSLVKDPALAESSPSLLTATLDSNKGPQSIDMQVLNNMVTNGDPCSGITGPVQPDGIHSEIATGNLLPEKLYTAIYSVRTKPASSPASAWVSSEVHRYPFQTSRYANFGEQVQSYVLSDELNNERYAVFNVDVALTTGQLSAVQAVIAGTETASDPLLQQFADPFDRIINGILGLPQLHPAQTTEFNIIRNTNNSNAIVAILIRNPEAFNDPKLPVNELTSTLTLSVNSGSTSGYLNVFSKDRSKIYMTRSSSLISTGSGEFTFQFKLYDGAAYAVVSTETATITLA